jgi:hypothetical protein
MIGHAVATHQILKAACKSGTFSTFIFIKIRARALVPTREKRRQQQQQLQRSFKALRRKKFVLSLSVLHLSKTHTHTDVHRLVRPGLHVAAENPDPLSLAARQIKK